MVMSMGTLHSMLITYVLLLSTWYLLLIPLKGPIDTNSKELAQSNTTLVVITVEMKMGYFLRIPEEAPGEVE